MSANPDQRYLTYIRPNGEVYLSAKAYRLLLYFAEGLGHKQISEKMNITQQTSKFYVSKIRKATGLTLYQLVALVYAAEKYRPFDT